MSFQQGLSGLNAAAKNLDAIGNNVANANTVGAKASRAEFADIYANSLYGAGSGFSGIGVSVSDVSQLFTQGDIATTGNPLDMAINGRGFFRMSTNGTVSYTRNGQFKMDKEGHIVNAQGARLTGYPADANGQVNAGVPQELQLTSRDSAPSATKTAKLSLNLDARKTAPTAAFNASDSATYAGTTTLSVYDQQGNSHALTLYFRKTGDNSWDVYASGDGKQIGSGAVASMKFKTDGSLDTSATTMPISIALPVGAAAGGTLNIAADLSKATQFGSDYAVSEQTQDGYTTGQLVGFSVDKTGTIQARYTNGQTLNQGRVALANFANPQGLASQGGNAWSETYASGQPLIGAPGSGSLGLLQSSAVENSNIDMSAELVNMITAQRSYQANAQTIKTQDAIVQTMVNLR
jgi:flagellar hook protein FlgE